MIKQISALTNIQNFVQECALAISEVLEIEVTIMDEYGVRIGGTGKYSGNIGELIPLGSYFQSVLQEGRPGSICDAQKQPQCETCVNKDTCMELATMGFPILKQGRPVGVIGLIAFTEEQRIKMLDFSPKLVSFLRHMSSLLESKLLLDKQNQRLQQQVQNLKQQDDTRNAFDSILGNDRTFREVIEKAQHVAKSNSTVLLRGESGTGKEVLARAIHRASPRNSQSFIAINCASIPEQLLESELFGYEAGTFTGANRSGKIGKFEMANNGTIFLDEIGDMPLVIQPKLLRVLQERKVDRIGGKNLIDVDVRIIAATNRNLEEMMKQGTFREDLYYRLNIIPVTLPPLRERPLDIAVYIQFFRDRYAGALGKESVTLEPALLNWLQGYQWPGNIRQLENTIEYMVNVCKTDTLTMSELPDYIKNANYLDVNSGLEEQISVYEKNILMRHISSGMSLEDKEKVAKKLKISRATLYRKLDKYQLH